MRLEQPVRIKDENIKTVQESAEQHSVEEYNLFNMKSEDQRKPYTVTLDVNGKPPVMETDTGASYSVNSGATHKRLWTQKQLMPTTVKLCTYTGEPMAVKESMMDRVHYADKEVKLSLLVLTDDSPSLLDQDWLQHLNRDRQQINKLHTQALQ